jgi:hypothetical protein
MFAVKPQTSSYLDYARQRRIDLGDPGGACAAKSAGVTSPFLTRAASAVPSCCAHSFQLIGNVIRFTLLARLRTVIWRRGRSTRGCGSPDIVSNIAENEHLGG